MDDVLERMAIMEAHRKNSKCERMIFGDYVGNVIRCQTCLKDCDYWPTSKPTDEEVQEARNAIIRFRYSKGGM